LQLIVCVKFSVQVTLKDLMYTYGKFLQHTDVYWNMSFLYIILLIYVSDTEEAWTRSLATPEMKQYTRFLRTEK
jgi:hypothetical protein